MDKCSRLGVDVQCAVIASGFNSTIRLSRAFFSPWLVITQWMFAFATVHAGTLHAPELDTVADGNIMALQLGTAGVGRNGVGHNMVRHYT